MQNRDKPIKERLTRRLYSDETASIRECLLAYALELNVTATNIGGAHNQLVEKLLPKLALGNKNKTRFPL